MERERERGRQLDIILPYASAEFLMTNEDKRDCTGITEGLIWFAEPSSLAMIPKNENPS